MQEKNMIFLKKKTCHSQTGGRGGGSPTWEKFPHFPVFFGGELPLLMMVRYKRLGSPGAEGAFPIPTVRRRNIEQQQGDPPSHCDFWKSEQMKSF